jgi:hypothetical protein
LVVIDPSLVYENEINLDTHTKLVCGWKHNQIYTKSSLRSCTFIFTHKCKKVESKLFNHCQTIEVLNIESIICCIQKMKFVIVLKVIQKYFWNWVGKLCSKILLH